MKRRLLSVIVLALMLTACGSQTEKNENQQESVTESLSQMVEEKLQGSWTVTIKGEMGDTVATYKFSNGSFTCDTNVLGIDLMSKSGIYEITDSTIVLKYEEGTEGELAYTYSSGELTVKFDEDRILKKAD